MENTILEINAVQTNAISRKKINPARERENLRPAINTLFDLGAHKTDEEPTRNMVRDILKGFVVEKFSFPDAQNNLLQRTYELIKIIEEKGTAYLSVDTQLFYRAEGGQELKWGVKKSGRKHAVALVGYSVRNDKFFIKDSNRLHLIEINPKGLFISMNNGKVLVPIHQDKG